MVYLTLAGFGGKAPPRTDTKLQRVVSTHATASIAFPMIQVWVEGLYVCYTDFTLIESLQGRYQYYLHFVDEKVETANLVPSARGKTDFRFQDCAFNRSPGVLKVGSRPATPAPSGNLWEMQILGPHLRSTEAEALGLGPSHLCFRNPSRWFWSMLKSKNHCITQTHLPGVHGSSLSHRFILRSLGEPGIILRMSYIDKDSTNNHICTTL